MRLILLLSIFITISFITFGQIPTEGLIAYYPFNGNANDQSGNGNHGIVTGASLTTDRRGESISAYSFDGVNDGISVTGFNINPQSFTISLWFFARTDGDANSKELIQRSDPSNKNDWCWNISWYKKNGPSKVYSGVKTANGMVTDSADSAPKNNWNHIIMTWDGSTKRVYVNGLLKRTKSLPGTSIDYNNKSGLFIGYDSEAGFFNGKIDDIRIYNRVLSLSEMNQLNNEGETYSIKLLSPAGGEDFVAGANHEIRWTGIGVSSVRIDYSLDSGMTWLNLVSYFNNTGVFIWTTPNITSRNCMVKVSNSENTSMSALSATVFSIEQYKIKILSPDGDETCGIGSTFPITWNSNNIPFVNIDYSTDNGATWIPVAASIPSNGVYDWIVPNTPSLQALVKITNVDTQSVNSISSNNFIITTITGVEDKSEIPGSFSLLQNYPNPFNPSTKIEFNLPEAMYVEVKIHDLLGSEVATLVSSFLMKGNHEISFNAVNLPSGIYFYSLSAGNEIKIKKMQLVK
jgi:hypothetical protein